MQEGYLDRTDLVEASVIHKTSYAPIPDPAVQELITTLQQYANRALQDSYTVTFREVTETMIFRAQDVIHQMVLHAEKHPEDYHYFNKQLLRLFAIIPRKMKDVSSMLSSKDRPIALVLEEEQQLLDVMQAKIQREGIKTSGKKGTTLLEAYGLNARLCNEKENAQIKRFLTKESADLFCRAYRIRNEKTDRAFEKYCKSNHIDKEEIHYYYHGSKNRNYMGLLTQGICLNPKAPITGKMFGYGLYFAPRAKKSINYTDLLGSVWAGGNNHQAFLAVYKVAYKNPLHVVQHEDWMMQIAKGSSIAPHDALYAHAGVSLLNDEVIVYNEAQATLQYLIELKK